MSGYWSALFYEDQNSWTSAVADVCSTIVSYGVDIPWCVCSNSWGVLSVVTEYVTFAALFVAAFLRLEQWWCFEYSVVLFATLINLPAMVYKSRGDWFKLISHYGYGLFGLAWFGCFLETAAGLQGGVVFGGKLFYPSLILVALALQLAKMALNVVEKEMYGYGFVEESAKDARFVRVANFFRSGVGNESIVFLCIATFGLPKMAADTDIIPWLTVFPALSLWKLVSDYLTSEPVECKERNGDAIKVPEVAEKKPAAAPAAAAAAAPKAAAPATAEKKAEPAKEKPAEAAKEEEVKKPEPSLLDGVKRASCKVCSAACSSVSYVCSLVKLVHCKVLSLPWEFITNLVLRIGTLFAYTWAFWSLTEDLAVLVFPVATYLAPIALTKFSAKMSREVENLARDVCLFSVAGLQYYLFKTNITQY